MIGDGYTDLEASPPAVSSYSFTVGVTAKLLNYNMYLQDTFIGFGGNVIRENVREQASWYVYHFHELIEELASPTVKGMKMARRMSSEYNSDAKKSKTKKALTYGEDKTKPQK